MKSLLICNVCLIHILGFTRILKEIIGGLRKEQEEYFRLIRQGFVDPGSYE